MFTLLLWKTCRIHSFHAFGWFRMLTFHRCLVEGMSGRRSGELVSSLLRWASSGRSQWPVSGGNNIALDDLDIIVLYYNTQLKHLLNRNPVSGGKNIGRALDDFDVRLASTMSMPLLPIARFKNVGAQSYQTTSSSVCLSVCRVSRCTLFVCLYVCVCVYAALHHNCDVCLSVCMSVCLCAGLSVCKSVWLCVCPKVRTA